VKLFICACLVHVSVDSTRHSVMCFVVSFYEQCSSVRLNVVILVKTVEAVQGACDANFSSS